MNKPTPKPKSHSQYGGPLFTFDDDALIVTGKTTKSVRLSFKGVDLGLHKGKISDECKPK